MMFCLSRGVALPGGVVLLEQRCRLMMFCLSRGVVLSGGVPEVSFGDVLLA